jgi:hypothetical protein
MPILQVPLLTLHAESTIAKYYQGCLSSWINSHNTITQLSNAINLHQTNTHTHKHQKGKKNPIDYPFPCCFLFVVAWSAFHPLGICFGENTSTPFHPT